jgi:hypothetical protein
VCVCVCVCVSVPSTINGPKIRFLLLSDSCGFFDVGAPSLTIGRSVFYDCCWAPRTQSLQGPNSWEFLIKFTLSDLRLFQFGGPGPRICMFQGHVDPVTNISLGNRIPFLRLPHLVTQRWSYSNPILSEISVSNRERE